LGAIREVARAGETDQILFMSGKQRTILPANFTKFEHITSIGVVMNLFGTEL